MDILKQENRSTCASRIAVLNHRRRSGKAIAVVLRLLLWLDVADKKENLNGRIRSIESKVSLQTVPFFRPIGQTGTTSEPIFISLYTTCPECLRLRSRI